MIDHVVGKWSRQRTPMNMLTEMEEETRVIAEGITGMADALPKSQ